MTTTLDYESLKEQLFTLAGTRCINGQCSINRECSETQIRDNFTTGTETYTDTENAEWSVSSGNKPQSKKQRTKTNTRSTIDDGEKLMPNYFLRDNKLRMFIEGGRGYTNLQNAEKGARIGRGKKKTTITGYQTLYKRAMDGKKEKLYGSKGTSVLRTDKRRLTFLQNVFLEKWKVYHMMDAGTQQTRKNLKIDKWKTIADIKSSEFWEENNIKDLIGWIMMIDFEHALCRKYINDSGTFEISAGKSVCPIPGEREMSKKYYARWCEFFRSTGCE